MIDDKTSILSRDYSTVERNQNLWEEEIKMKGNVRQAISEYIEFFEGVLVNESNPCQRDLIEKKIKKLKKLRDQYYVPSILGRNWVVEHRTKRK